MEGRFSSGQHYVYCAIETSWIGWCGKSQSFIHGLRTPNEGMMNHRSQKYIFGPYVVAKYASAVTKNWGLGFKSRPCLEESFFGKFCTNTQKFTLMKIFYTMRRNLLNWCNLVSISKKLMFYVFGVVRIY